MIYTICSVIYGKQLKWSMCYLNWAKLEKSKSLWWNTFSISSQNFCLAIQNMGVLHSSFLPEHHDTHGKTLLFKENKIVGVHVSCISVL